MTAMTMPRFERPVLLLALSLAIPAFYLTLTEATAPGENAGHWLYGVVAALLAIDLLFQFKAGEVGKADSGDRSGVHPCGVDVLLLAGALASAWPTAVPWSGIEWLFRLAYCAIVFTRLAGLMARYFAPRRLLSIGVLALAVLGIAGGGFLWLEPRVNSYADGVWLAFITGATVGYGDLVPSTSASRIFAAFIVVLGYALFSVVTASIAALLVGEDEKRAMRGLHADMRLLRQEIVALRAELRAALHDADGRANPD